MKHALQRYTFPALFLLLLGGLLGSRLEWSAADKDTTEQLRKLEEAFLIINKRYVEELEPADVAERAIEAMLAGLDPHSTYIDAESFVEVNESYEGSFGGIGIWFEIPRGDTAQVVSVIEGGPSERAGLRAGDRIVTIGDTSAVGLGEDEIKRRLKGPIGTKVDVELKRFGVGRALPVTITRDRIPLHSVTSAYMMDERTAYIRIGWFGHTTYGEFFRELARLKEEGMNRLVLDLRDNPGGIMDAAVAIVDELLRDGQIIVYTRGRAVPDQMFRSSRPGVFESQPVIVLVNGNSVSASEIVAGALQDHDRALIVGQRTYGKGLVQNQFALPDNSRLQMTTARYYTPSGRLIQQPYVGGDRAGYIEDKLALLNEASRDPGAYIQGLADSLKYTTTGGRTVYGGGGVLPDVVIGPDTTLSPVMRAVYSGTFLGSFRLWFREHEQALRARWENQQEGFMDAFAFDAAAWKSFWETAGRSPEPIALGVAEEGLSPGLTVFLAKDLEAHRETVELYFKALLARQLFGSEAAYPVYNQVDLTVQEATGLWAEAEQLVARPQQ